MAVLLALLFVPSALAAGPYDCGEYMIIDVIPAGYELVMLPTDGDLPAQNYYVAHYMPGTTGIWGGFRCQDGREYGDYTDNTGTTPYFGASCSPSFSLVLKNEGSSDQEIMGLSFSGDVCTNTFDNGYTISQIISPTPTPPPPPSAESPTALSIDLSLIFQYASNIVSLMMPIVGVGAGISFGFALVAYIIRLFGKIF